MPFGCAADAPILPGLSPGANSGHPSDVQYRAACCRERRACKRADSMDYVKLGNTGLDVSRICLGCMTYGEPSRGTHSWTLDDAASRPLIRRAVELGINFFDTSNSYSDGSSEEILGRALRESARRDEVVIATKVYFPQRT